VQGGDESEVSYLKGSEEDWQWVVNF
jgi:hypothetical protein